MKQHTTMIGSLVLLLGLTQAALAQTADDGPQRPPRDQPRQRGAGEFRPQFDPPPNPLLIALDADRDGELSESEIANATVALAKLDRNKDGKLSRQELRPPGARPPGDGEARGRSPELFVQRVMSQDKNGDGKVSKEELPERMQRNFDRLDANSDGYIDRKEAGVAASRVRPPGGRPADRDRARPDRPQRED